MVRSGAPASRCTRFSGVAGRAVYHERTMHRLVVSRSSQEAKFNRCNAVCFSKTRNCLVRCRRSSCCTSLQQACYQSEQSSAVGCGCSCTDCCTQCEYCSPCSHTCCRDCCPTYGQSGWGKTRREELCECCCCTDRYIGCRR